DPRVFPVSIHDPHPAPDGSIYLCRCQPLTTIRNTRDHRPYCPFKRPYGVVMARHCQCSNGNFPFASSRFGCPFSRLGHGAPENKNGLSVRLRLSGGVCLVPAETQSAGGPVLFNLSPGWRNDLGIVVSLCDGLFLLADP